MKAKLLLTFIGTILLLAACNDKTSKWRVKTSYHVNRFKMEDSVFTNDGLTYTAVYSAEGKLIGNKLSNGNRVEFVTGTIADTTKTFNAKGEQIEKAIKLKNEKGLVDSMPQYGMDGTTNKYIYDAEGNAVEMRQYKFGDKLQFVERYKYTAGLNTATEYMSIGAIDTIQMLNPKIMEMETIIQKTIGDTSTYHYDYYPNRENSAAYVKYLKEHWGDGSTQLKKTRVQITRGDTTNVYNYRYTFDEQNRVTSIVTQSTKGFEFDSTAYTYY